MTLVDTIIVVDVLTADPVWSAWSTDWLAKCRETGPLRINEVTYAELAVRMEFESDLQSALSEMGMALERTPTTALFLAGRAFNRYRGVGGPRTSVPDFFIGAHAEAAQIPILTRDVRRYRTYFPEVMLIAPEE